MAYTPTFLPDGRKEYNPQRTMRDIYDEWDAFTEQVRKDDPSCRFPDLEAKNRWQRQEQQAERFSEWQARVWHPRMAAIAAAKDEHRIVFTREEIERLVEHFAGANDPVAQSIHAKAAEQLAVLASIPVAGE